MKTEFINKWKCWWMLQEKGVELTDAFERELNDIIQAEDWIVITNNVHPKEDEHILIGHNNIVIEEKLRAPYETYGYYQMGKYYSFVTKTEVKNPTHFKRFKRLKNS